VTIRGFNYDSKWKCEHNRGKKYGGLRKVKPTVKSRSGSRLSNPRCWRRTPSKHANTLIADGSDKKQDASGLSESSSRAHRGILCGGRMGLFCAGQASQYRKKDNRSHD